MQVLIPTEAVHPVLHEPCGPCERGRTESTVRTHVMFSALNGHCFSEDGRSRQGKENIYSNSVKALVFEVCDNLLTCSRELWLQT